MTGHVTTDRVLSLSLMVFYVTCNDISVIYVTAQMGRQTEEDVPVLHRHGTTLFIR